MRSGGLPATASRKRYLNSKGKTITHIISVKENRPLETGLKTRYWCCQDENRRKKPCPSQKEGVKHRDTLGMHCYDCKGRLNVSYRANPRAEEKTYKITVWLEHHAKHTPYYDVSLPPGAAALIRENLEWFSPHEVAKLVLQTYPSISANQVRFAWTKMSETLWKRDKEQLPSVKALLSELKSDVAVLDMPEMEGVEQIAWVMKKIVLPLKGKIVEVGIDATCKRLSKHETQHANKKVYR